MVQLISFSPGNQYCVDTANLTDSGKVSVTQAGIDCQRWDSQHPHTHGYTDPARFADDTLADAANYCRAPDGRTLPWCYTTSADQRWNYCDIDMIFKGSGCEVII